MAEPLVLTDHGLSEPSTYKVGLIKGVVFRSLETHSDERGWLCELFRIDSLDSQLHPQMAYISETLPGVVRGPHEHVEQSDCFAFVGPGRFKLYLWDSRQDSPTYGNKHVVEVGEQNMQSVIIPPGVVHAYKNIGTAPGWVFNAPNRLYAGEGKRQPVDEIRHEDENDSRYVTD